MHLVCNKKRVPTHAPILGRDFTETRWENETKQKANSEKLNSIHDFGMNNAHTANH